MTIRLNRLLISFLLLLTALQPASAGLHKAPGFSLKDYQGNLVSLKDYQGKPLVLHFWATWCPYCKKVQPAIEHIKQGHQGNVQVLAISFREDEGAKPQVVLDKRGYTFTILLEGDAVAKSYGVKGTPTTFFINKTGDIVKVTYTSDPEDSVWSKWTQKLLEE